MNKDQYAEKVISLISTRRTVSFIEIENMLSSHIDVKGNIAMCLPKYPTIVLWANMSQQFFDIMIEVLKTKKVSPKSTDPLVYAMDGKLLKFPIAKSARQYKEEHWLPVVFNPSS